MAKNRDLSELINSVSVNSNNDILLSGGNVGISNPSPSHSLDVSGSARAGFFIKSGSSSSEILAGDGSVITAGTNITISGGTISSTGGSGVTSVANVGTNPTSSGATITGSVLTLQPANSTNPGVISTTTQTLAGNKTFSSIINALGGIATSNAANNSSLYATSQYPVSAQTDSGLLFGGASSVQAKLISNGSGSLNANNTLTANASYATWILGSGPLIRAASGTHSLVSQFVIKPLNIISGSATITNTATLYIEGANTTGSNNYALWVDSGTTKLEGPVVLGAGDSISAPLKFTTSGSSLISSGAPVGGEMEVDSQEVLYYHNGTNNRGVIPAEQFLVSTSTRTLTSTTAQQALFSLGLGSSTLQANESSSYFFECFFTLSSMSATTGNCGFQLSGSFTTSSAAFWVQGLDNTTLTTANAIGGVYVAGGATTSNIVSASAGTSMAAMVRGTFRTITSGSVFPSINLINASAAVVGVNSYFRMYLIGDRTVTNTNISIA